MNHKKNDLLWIIGIALILRVALLISNLSLPIKYYIDPDAYDYDIAAINLLEGNGFSGDLEPPYTPDIFRTPTYPLFIAIFYALSGRSQAIVILAQIILGSLTAGILYLLILEWGGSRRAALIAGAFLAIDQLTILNVNLLMSETLFTFLLVFTLFSLFLYWHSEQIRWGILAAFLLGIAILARPIGQFLPLAFLPLFILAAKTGKRWKALFQWGIFFALSSLLMYSWAYHNYKNAEIFTLSVVGDYNLAYYRGRAVLEEVEGISEEEAWSRVDEMVVAQGGNKNSSAAEMAKIERNLGIAIFSKYPVDTLIVHIKGAIRFLANPGLNTICIQINRENNADGCTPSNITPKGFIGKIRAKFSSMSTLQIFIALWGVLLLLLLYLGSAAGIFILFRDKEWLVLGSILLIILYFVAISAGGETTSRFRIPSVPFFALLAGFGFDWVATILANSHQKSP